MACLVRVNAMNRSNHPARASRGGSAGEQGIGLSELSDLIRVHRRNERLARGEVAIQGADADTGVLGQCAHRRIHRAAGEELPAALDQSLRLRSASARITTAYKRNVRPLLLALTGRSFRIVHRPLTGGHAMTKASPPLTTPFDEHSTAEEVLADVDLSGRRAIVTGASSGIGTETARVLAPTRRRGHPHRTRPGRRRDRRRADPPEHRQPRRRRSPP